MWTANAPVVAAMLKLTEDQPFIRPDRPGLARLAARPSATDERARNPASPDAADAGHQVHHYGDRLVKLLLYGSQARGDARPWSDVDVLAVL